MSELDSENITSLTGSENVDSSVYSDNVVSIYKTDGWLKIVTGILAGEAKSPHAGRDAGLPPETAGWRWGSEEWNWRHHLSVQQVSEGLHRSGYHHHGDVTGDYSGSVVVTLFNGDISCGIIWLYYTFQCRRITWNDRVILIMFCVDTLLCEARTPAIAENVKKDRKLSIRSWHSALVDLDLLWVVFTWND